VAQSPASRRHRELVGRCDCHQETVRVTKAGQRLGISPTVSPVRDADGRIIGASKIARDITDRKRAEDALRQTMARYEQQVCLFDGVASQSKRPV
jgi:PAS domain S-box-containing protein